ncbi:putative symporter YjmB [Oerskovia enterophila]|uniref:Symporter YjmB n=1 Tax=Oerskovia enterophila TaxID=43678 RepID=A0A161YF31_9CELL|nr:putative symporter YjmB [Oerskovia enterophila]OCI32065.1 putative symporter YjmB [Oerskovia enterophila]
MLPARTLPVSPACTAVSEVTSRLWRVERLRPRTIAGYAIGSVGTGGFGTLPGLMLLYYLTDALAVPAAVAGLVVTGAKVWDVVIDPFIGYGSDRDLVRTGSRRRFMTIGAVAIPVFFALTFAVPAGASTVAASIWVLVAFLLAATAFSMFQVPYIALPAEIAPTYDERTRLISWRVATLAFAILLFGAGGPVLRGETSSLSGYLTLGVVAGLVIGAGMFVASRVAPRGARAAGPTAPLPPGAQAAAPAAAVSALGAFRIAVAEAVSTLRRSQPFRVLLTAFFLQALATGLMLAAANYVATYVLESDLAVSLLFAALIAPALLVMPLWNRLARRVGKERSFVLASALFALATLCMVPLAWAPGAWVYLPTALAGVGYAGMQALPLAMLPDVIAHDARTTPGVADRGGAFSGVWTAGETTGMAFGAGLLSLVQWVTGYQSSSAGVTPEQSSAAIDGIALSFSLVPAVLVALSLVALVRYRLRRGDIDVPTEESAAHERP